MKVLALDQSTRVTGWAVFADGALQEYGKFDAENAGKEMGKRLEYIRNKVKNLIEENNVTEVIIEDIQLQGNVANNVQTFKTLAEVFGVISELLTEMNIPQSAVLASSWKSALGIKGRARAEQKRAAQEWVVSTYNVRPTQDECDSICIGSYKLKTSDGVAGFDWAD